MFSSLSKSAEMHLATFHQTKITASNQGMRALLFLIRHLHLSNVQLGVDLKTDTKKAVCSTEIIFRALHLLTRLASIVNIIGGTYTSI